MGHGHKGGFISRLVESHSTLHIFWICGLASILVDVDHAISLLLWRYVNNQIAEGRIWHTPLFILTSIAICYLGAHLRGLYSRLVLVGVVAITVLVLTYSPHVVWGITG